MSTRPTPENVMVDAIAHHVYEHPVRVVTHTERHGSGSYANLIDANGRHGISQAILDALAEHGYRIVHPDDVPAGETQRPSTGHVHDEPSWVLGWYDCRRQIFGDATAPRVAVTPDSLARIIRATHRYTLRTAGRSSHGTLSDDDVVDIIAAALADVPSA